MVSVRSGRAESEHIAIMPIDDNCKGKVWMSETYAIRKWEVDMGMKLHVRTKSYPHHDNRKTEVPSPDLTSR